MRFVCFAFGAHFNIYSFFLLFIILSRLVFPMTFVFLMSASPSNRVIHRAASHPGSGWVGHFWSPTHFDPLLVTEHNIKWSFHPFMVRKIPENSTWNFRSFVSKKLNTVDSRLHLDPSTWQRWTQQGKVYRPNPGKQDSHLCLCLFEVWVTRRTSELLFHTPYAYPSNTTPGRNKTVCATRTGVHPTDEGKTQRH